MATLQPHELVREFKNNHFELNNTLEKMLNEHYSHQTERRGCGYTQATRHLAEYINRPRAPDVVNDLRLFQDWQSTLKPVLGFFRKDFDTSRQVQLRKIPRLMKQEESAVLAQMIVDVVLPIPHTHHDSVILPSHTEKLAIGSCPLAEKYFLELAHKHVKRGGLMNIITDDNNRPLLIEKMNLGDNHSCLSLVPLIMNGVRLPPGSLLGVDYDDQALQKSKRKLIPGYQIRLADCRGFRFLRLTTLAITPENRARAFSTHFEAQRANGLFEPESTQLTQLSQITQAELRYTRSTGRSNMFFYRKESTSFKQPIFN